MSHSFVFKAFQVWFHPRATEFHWQKSICLSMTSLSLSATFPSSFFLLCSRVKKQKQNKDEGTKRSDAAHRTALFQRAHKDSQGERVKGEQLEQNNGRQEERVRVEDEDGGSDGGAGVTETRQRKKLRFYWRHKAWKGRQLQCNRLLQHWCSRRIMKVMLWCAYTPFLHPLGCHSNERLVLGEF